jgi:hypothetical protein
MYISQRSADTGWGSKNDEPRWKHDKYEGSGRHYDRRKEDDSKYDDNKGRW